MSDYFEERTFEFPISEPHQLNPGTYESCRFINSNFTAIDLSEIRFVECSFEACILDRVHLSNTTLNDVQFKDCKMMGIDFTNCQKVTFSVRFENCILNFSDFSTRKMQQTCFKECNLTEVDFTETDLTESSFEKCDLTNSKFDRTILVKADLSTAFNFSIDPETNTLKKAKFSSFNISGLLNKYHIVIDG